MLPDWGNSETAVGKVSVGPSFHTSPRAKWPSLSPSPLRCYSKCDARPGNDISDDALLFHETTTLTCFSFSYTARPATPKGKSHVSLRSIVITDFRWHLEGVRALFSVTVAQDSCFYLYGVLVFHMSSSFSFLFPYS